MTEAAAAKAVTALDVFGYILAVALALGLATLIVGGVILGLMWFYYKKVEG